MPGLSRLWTSSCAVLAGVVLAVPLLARQNPPQGDAQSKPPEPPANGVISGTVFDGATGEPVVNALVNLQPALVTKPMTNVITRAITDEKGRFVFQNLPGPSEFTVAVTKSGYLGGGFGRELAPTEALRRIVLKDGEWVGGLRVTIWKPGAISGVVRDEAGEPAVGVLVRALLRIRLMGRDDFAAGPMVLTDDRGAYRILGLAPGRYYVQVPSVQASVPSDTKFPALGQSLSDALDVDESHRLVIGRYPLPPPPVDGRQLAYPLMFHPSTSQVAEATPIDLRYGDDRSAIDITLRPVASVRITGLVEAPPDALRQLTLRLLPAGLESLGLGAEAATALVAPDGRFTFMNVPAGSYTLDAPVQVTELLSQASATNFRRSVPMPPPAQGRGISWDTVDIAPGLDLATTTFRGGQVGEYSGRMPLIVPGADLSGVVLRLRPHATMSGRVIVESDPAQPDVKPPTRFTIYLDAARGETHLGRPQSSFQDQPGEFTITGIVPGQYWLRVPGYAGWVVKSVTWNGRDRTMTPFDAAEAPEMNDVVVTVTNATPQLTGTVRATEELKAENTIVIAFPFEATLWRGTGFYPARMKSAPVTTTGAYRFTALPAGDYLLLAIDRTHANTWRETAFLERVARFGTRVRLEWSGKPVQDLTPVVVR